MSAPAGSLARKFESIAGLTQHQREALDGLTGVRKQLKAGEIVVAEGARPSCVTLLVAGMLCRYKVLQGGERQIMAVHTPGDIPDMQSIHISRMDHTLAAVAPSTIILLPHPLVRAFFDRHPDIAALCWRDTLIDAAIFREWMVGLGRRDAYSRMARFFCEIFVKMRVVGLADGNSCDLPLTQTDLADSLGLSSVHVNRTLQELRAAGLADLRRGTLSVENWAGLQEAGEFDAGYLHLQPEHGALAASDSSLHSSL
jgi:CRP-like cAMP-binding protein